ncbi:MAG: hypothetical protein QME52_14425 [Bacteroidota bacterium]|nr:hypothetical protein [Bacteroidota bacterium]
MSVSLEETREQIRSLSDQELVEMIEVKFRDHNPETIMIANEIAQSRGGLGTIKQ